MSYSSTKESAGGGALSSSNNPYPRRRRGLGVGQKLYYRYSASKGLGKAVDLESKVYFLVCDSVKWE